MKVVGVIPVRMASSRFPGKPLAKIRGLSMVEHVYRRALMTKTLDQVVIATCDKEIEREVQAFGGEAILTSDQHLRCTDRVAEAARQLEAEVVVNIQGDEPLLQPSMVDKIVEPFASDESVVCTTVIAVIDESEADNPNVVKTVCAQSGDVLYFSREPIPSRKMGVIVPMFKQVGIYAFTHQFLLRFDRLPETPLERAESVDLMRALEHGFPVRGVVCSELSLGVDTPQDLLRCEELMKDDALFPSYG